MDIPTDIPGDRPGGGSLNGRLLLSSARLEDPDFRHAVILLGEHRREGAIGVVLIRPLNMTVAKGFRAR
jgi:putative AlgH/UPF0301 family transcriptional regulator